MDKLEKKFGKYAVKNLSLILICCYVVGYIIELMDKTGLAMRFLSLNPALILKGQVWRLFTWVLIPPSGFDFFTIIMLIFYYSIGHTLERVWGDFKYNLYIFSGMLFTILGSFALLGLLKAFPSLMVYTGNIFMEMDIVSVYYLSTYYINMSIFLGFACTFPDNMVLLMFIIPLKMKWMGIAYGALLVYNVIAGDIYTRVTIIASLLNFVVFFILYRKGLSPKMQYREMQRKREFKEKMQAAETMQKISKHRCAICGRTEQDNPDLQFRFCSKCNGNYEYCNDHLFNHTHVQ